MNVKELATFYQAAIIFNAQGWDFIKEKKSKQKINHAFDQEKKNSLLKVKLIFLLI